MVRQEQEAWKQDATDSGFRGQLRVMTEGHRLFVAGFLFCVFVSFWFVLWGSFCLFHYLFFIPKNIQVKIRISFEVKRLVSPNVLLFLCCFYILPILILHALAKYSPSLLCLGHVWSNRGSVWLHSSPV